MPALTLSITLTLTCGSYILCAHPPPTSCCLSRSKGKITCILLLFYSGSPFIKLLDRSGSRAPLIDSPPYILVGYNFSRLWIIVFFLSVFHVLSLSCCHWRLIPTSCNWRGSTFGQRHGVQLKGPELTFTSSIYFYCSSIYCCCNSPLIVISPPCRVFWYLKFFLNSFVLLNNSKVHFRLTFLDFPSPLFSLASQSSCSFKLFTVLSARNANATGPAFCHWSNQQNHRR